MELRLHICLLRFATRGDAVELLLLLLLVLVLVVVLLLLRLPLMVVVVGVIRKRRCAHWRRRYGRWTGRSSHGSTAYATPMRHSTGTTSVAREDAMNVFFKPQAGT